MGTYNKGKYFGIGVENWFLLMSIFCGINVALGTWKLERIDNFITPSEFLNLTWTFLREYHHVIFVLYLSSFIQTNLCLVIEKLLQKDAISEGTGQIFYLINGVSLPNAFIVYCFCSNIGPFPAFFITAILVHLYCLKVLSYMHVNTKYRSIWLKNKEESAEVRNGNGTIKNGKEATFSYLESVNWKKLYLFMYVSPSLVYKPDRNIQWKLNISYFVTAFLKGVTVYYIGYNISKIFIEDELPKIILYINNGDYIQFLKTFIKIIIPVHITWLLIFYYLTFCIFFESWSKGVGYPLNQGRDWWNCENVAIFWSKWNVIVHEHFKETIYKPLLIAGIGKTTASTIVFAVSGLSHTYGFELPFKIFNGAGFIAMVTQVPLQEFTNFLAKKYGSKVSNCVIWLQLMLSHPLALIIIYYNYVSIHIK